MQQFPLIILIGPMGAGKTTIGRYLSTHLGMDFIDSDHLIQERTGVDIPTIFEIEGEEGFRRRETQVINELTQMSNIILATGGGAVLNAENRKNMASRGTVIYLECSAEQQYERTKKDKNRPLLQTDDPLSRLQALLQTRAPLYQQTADIIISTENKTTSLVAKEILEILNKRQPTGMY